MHNLANLFNQAINLHQAGKVPEAINLYLRILPFQKDNDELLFTIGTAYCQTGKAEEGVNYLRKASRINPKNFHIFGNMGTLLSELGRFDEAIINYNKAILINPSFPEGLFGRANALVELKAYEAAIVDYENALALVPNFAIAHSNKGKALFELGHYAEALDCYTQAIHFAPELAEIYCNQGHALQELNRLEEALASYKKAIALNPNFDEARRNLAITLYICGRTTEAVIVLDNALENQPNFAEARWMRAMFTLPAIPSSSSQAQSNRDRFQEALHHLRSWFTEKQLASRHTAVGSAQPYYLAYQEEDNRPLLSEYGTLCCQLMRERQFNINYINEPKSLGHPIKLGIISNHIYKHSVWDALISGWVEHLDRDRIHLTIFSSFSKDDLATEFARSTKSVLIKCDKDLTHWTNAINTNQMDVLIYPEVGMDAMTTKLASMRLAPVQIASWGHPETTGLPTIDYYLSANLLEPEISQLFYTEHLIKLPNLGCCVKREVVASTQLPLDVLGIAYDQPLFICPGTPFKYQPEHDHIFVDIAQKIGKCQFVFFTYRVKELTERLKERIALSFSEAGIDFNSHCVFVPWQPKDSFYGLMKQADVYLDTIGFSGFNTAIQAIECELPIVTREGKFMRGRLASGILKRIGLEELVTQNAEEYVNLAVRLAMDRSYNHLTRHKIAEHNHYLYEDLEPIRALENFIEDTCKSKQAPTPL